ncbi:MAG TPA: GTP 3',8-cyclase MoaA [Steroidobacteraceae bacterium]|nr:GTP 3',8-cyclase MoaA [Steroidobacteraceae bacterium]
MIASRTVNQLSGREVRVLRSQAAAGTVALRDAFGRTIDHLRLSVTSACDLHCVYCRPDRMGAFAGMTALTNAQRAEFVAFLHDRFQLAQVRITGGEPLLEKGVVELIRSIRRLAPRIEIAMTSNGRLLAQKAHALRAAGLDRLNVSLDSLDPAVHRRMTGGEVTQVLRGLAVAAAAGFPAPKLNTVVLRDYNDHEIADITAWALAHGHEVRFLEAMPIGPAAVANRRHLVSAREIRERLSMRFVLEPQQPAPGDTAKRFLTSANGHRGMIGIIAPVTEPFCGSCRRIRLTADGRLFPCLLDSRWVSLTPAWTNGRFDRVIAENTIRDAAGRKAAAGAQQINGMVAIGG